jgi:hypothetical protein
VLNLPIEDRWRHQGIPEGRDRLERSFIVLLDREDLVRVGWSQRTVHLEIVVS